MTHRTRSATNWNSSRSQAAKDKGQELRKTIEASLETLAEAVDDIRASEMFRAYLDMQAKFHRYSWGNSLLILSQCPQASQVAGYRKWQELGRQVRKGEKGIRIFAPCPFKREVERPSGETEEVRRMFFRCVSVFDVSQTEGEELPAVDVPVVDCVAAELLSRLEGVATDRGIRVEFGPIEGGAFGVSRNGSIGVDNGHPTGQQAKTLAHELAHEALHWKDKERGTFTRSLAELEAESVAYVVCRHYSLDVEVRASRYIALWGGDAKSLRDSLERIATTARGIIDDVDATCADPAHSVAKSDAASTVTANTTRKAVA